MERQTPIVTVVTGTRAEFGLLRPVIKKIMDDRELTLRLLVTGSHLCRDLGYTVDEITEAGFVISHTVDILRGDAGRPVPQALADAITGFSEYFCISPPDLVLVLGDRYEIFGAVTAAALQDIPVAHISGGETTEGAKDEFFRHCITKMSALHFPSTEPYRKRVIQLGEQPDRVFNAGSLGAENILTLPPMSRKELSDDIGFDVTQPFVLCTYHPETLGGLDPVAGLDEMLAAVDALSLRCLFTAANADAGGDAINARLALYCADNPQSKLVKSLGARRYLSAMRYCDAVLGNSSSAIVEAPTLHKPAVNIGERQKGRITGGNTITCAAGRDSIEQALHRALSPGFAEQAADAESPYGQGDASRVILREIKTALLDGVSLKKTFYDIDFSV